MFPALPTSKSFLGPRAPTYPASPEVGMRGLVGTGLRVCPSVPIAPSCPGQIYPSGSLTLLPGPLPVDSLYPALAP